MALDVTYITNFKSGWNTYVQPENLPDDGFTDLEDVICYRGTLRKRDGILLLATVPNVAISNITQAANGQVTTFTNHNLTSGQAVLITGVVGMTQINSSTVPYTITVTGATTFNLNVNTTAFSAYISGGTVSLPIMGLVTHITTTFFWDLFVFTENKVYLFSSGTLTDISGATLWTGGDSNFFWSANYQGAVWVTNNFDPVRYYLNGTTWTNFEPQLVSTDPTNILNTALIVVEYKDRLVFLNTNEQAGSINFPQRARWSQNGTPYVTAPVPTGGSFDATAWYEDVPGKGGFIDAPTSEKIVTSEFVKDTLVVGFEQSTWRLRYTGNEILPFLWERINSTLGSTSTYSHVANDDSMSMVGRQGVITSDTNFAQRIDQVIPDQVFNISQLNNGQRRVWGVRDIQRQLIYWNYPDINQASNIPYPNRMLVYNYVESNWNLYNFMSTALGTFRLDLSPGNRWNNTFTEWQDTFSQWVSGDLQYDFPATVVGDQLGNLFQMDSEVFGDQPAGNFVITTKKFNPYANKGMQCKAVYLDILCASGTNSGPIQGEFTVEHFIDEDSDNPIETLTVPTATITNQDKIWRRVILSGISQYHQFTITFSPEQLDDEFIPFDPIVIYALALHTAPGGRLNYGDDSP
jgi:hypothetical protein